MQSYDTSLLSVWETWYPTPSSSQWTSHASRASPTVWSASDSTTPSPESRAISKSSSPVRASSQSLSALDCRMRNHCELVDSLARGHGQKDWFWGFHSTACSGRNLSRGWAKTSSCQFTTEEHVISPSGKNITFKLSSMISSCLDCSILSNF